MIRCVVFDLDLTLVDIGDLFYRVFAQVTRSAGLEPVRFEKVGEPWASALEQTVARHPELSGVTAQPHFADAWEQVLMEMLAADEVRLYPGARAVLDELRASGRKLCLATNTPKRFVQIKLEALELRPYFEAVFTPQDPWGGKPRPEALFHVMKLLRLDADEMAMVGDHATDVLYGKNAGIKTVAILKQYNTSEELSAAGADRVIEGIENVPEAVTDLERDGLV